MHPVWNDTEWWKGRHYGDYDVADGSVRYWFLREDGSTVDMSCDEVEAMYDEDKSAGVPGYVKLDGPKSGEVKLDGPKTANPDRVSVDISGWKEVSYTTDGAGSAFVKPVFGDFSMPDDVNPRIAYYDGKGGVYHSPNGDDKCPPDCGQHIIQVGPIAEGLSPDAEIVTNEHGAKQSAVGYRLDLIPATAMFAEGETLKVGAERYAEWNWRGISVAEHLNHALGHIFAQLAGDESDDHLAHARCRLGFAIDLLARPYIPGEVNGGIPDETPRLAQEFAKDRSFSQQD